MDNLIKLDIDEDYYGCIGAYENVSLLLKNMSSLKIKSGDTSETKFIKKGRKKDILVDLGRIGELAYKYLLKLKQVEIYPNLPYNQFDRSALYKTGVLSDLVNRGYLNETDKNEIVNYESGGSERFHNFMLLELIVERVMPNVYNEFVKLLNYTFYSSVINEFIRDNYYKLDEGYEYSDYFIKGFLVFSIFPKYLDYSDSGVLNYFYEGSRKEIIKIVGTAKNNGDIFTRFRYYSNQIDADDVSFEEIEDIYKYISVLIRFIKEIHKQNNLVVNSDVIHARDESINIMEYLFRDENSINTIFDKYGSKDIVFLENLLFSNLSINDKKDELFELKKIFSEYKIEFDDCDLISIMDNNIRPKILKLFFEHNIFDFKKICSIIYTKEEDQIITRTYDEICRLIDVEKSKKRLCISKKD